MLRHLTPLAPVCVLAVAAAALLPDQAGAQSLRGSRASITRMHSQAVEHDLPFHATPRGVHAAARRGDVHRLTGNADFRLHLVSFPYVTAETELFVKRLASQYRDACGEQLVVTSALRPSTRQPANSSARSVHPTGMAIDLRRPKGRCLSWLRTTLLALEKRGVIEATEERWPPHFHVAVFPTAYTKYLGVRVETRLASADMVAPPKPVAPAARRHEVRAGDTLWHLARRYGTTVLRIRSLNELASTRLRPGQELLIPAGS